MEEIWKDVKGYENLFKVSSLGRVYSKRTNKVLKLVKTKSGYLTLPTRIGGRRGKSVLFRVHRLVADAFLEPAPEELIEECRNTKYGVVPVNHKDGNKLNNYFGNLEWCSTSENQIHSRNLGLQLDYILKSQNIDSKGVNYIINNYKPYDRELGARSLSRKFGVSHSSILAIVNGRTYKNYKENKK